MAPAASDCHFRAPTENDGADVWTLVKSTGVLDLNSSYSYLMWCKFFRETSIVAEQSDKVVGFISGFIHPDKPNVLFIWQVAVDASQRGKGLATKMLFELLEREACEDVEYLQATVSPDNIASRKLFTRFAKKLNTRCEIREGFKPEDFPESNHEEEPLYHIGPFHS
ncbi:MAG TPA: diaminobutyrate acetyltransferase [Bacillales bacterium]|nr:diaminobutyrate acetyltransferase [Bacillales bacterium]